MNRSSRGRQAGISFIGLVFVMVVLAGVGVLVAQAIPTLLEYQAVVKAIDKSKDEPNPQAIRVAFEKASAVDDIKSVTPKDLEITKDGDKHIVKVAWNREIHMFGPAYLLMKYAYQSK